MDTFQVHDLIRIDTDDLIPACMAEPDWVRSSLRNAPWVVVRRAVHSGGLIPVGVRGRHRNQRWGGFIHSDRVRWGLVPAALRSEYVPESRFMLPAFQALRRLERSLADLRFAWGPGGSAAFEIASGNPTADALSDLDVVIRSCERIDKHMASRLMVSTCGLPSRIDIRIETPIGVFALE